MSYARMDHAEWMESNLSAERRANERARAAGKKLLYPDIPEELSPFQKVVCDILGIVGGGIYNAPISKWDWHWGTGVSVVWRGDLATYDFNRLTALVFLCHEARIRCDISPAMRNLRISFWPRIADRSKGGARFHPNIDEAVATLREIMPADHRIFQQGKPVPAADIGFADHAGFMVTEDVQRNGSTAA